MCQSVEGLAELAGKLEGEVTGENYTVVPSKSRSERLGQVGVA